MDNERMRNRQTKYEARTRMKGLERDSKREEGRTDLRTALLRVARDSHPRVISHCRAAATAELEPATEVHPFAIATFAAAVNSP
jgi:hypothetical protein